MLRGVVYWQAAKICCGFAYSPGWVVGVSARSTYPSPPLLPLRLPRTRKHLPFGRLYYSWPLRKPSNPKLCSFQTSKFLAFSRNSHYRANGSKTFEKCRLFFPSLSFSFLIAPVNKSRGSFTKSAGCNDFRPQNPAIAEG